MKQTPIQQAIEQIRIQAEDYRKRGNGDKSEALLDTINLLQSLLPYERECIEGAWKEGEAVGLNHCAETAQDYFTSTYNNPQGGGVE